MARNTQGNTEIKVEETGFVSGTSNEFLPELHELDSVMVGMKVYLLALTAACLTVLTGVLVSFKHSTSPLDVQFGLPEYLLLLGLASLPVVGFFATSFLCSPSLRDDEFATSEVVVGKELGDSITRGVHVRTDLNNTTASTVTEVTSLLAHNPLVHALVVGAAVIAGVVLSGWPTHNQISVDQIQQSQYSKLGELLETRPVETEGNQQPSTVNGKEVAVKVQRLADEEPTNNSATSAQHESDDIVHARRNTGRPVNGLKFNNATILRSRYVPGSEISASNMSEAVTYLTETSGGAVTAYPTVTSESFMWLNARERFMRLYLSDEPEFAYGFTGFKPAQDNLSLVGQVLCLGAFTVRGPRYHKWLYGITG